MDMITPDMHRPQFPASVFRHFDNRVQNDGTPILIETVLGLSHSPFLVMHELIIGL